MAASCIYFITTMSYSRGRSFDRPDFDFQEGTMTNRRKRNSDEELRTLIQSYEMEDDFTHAHVTDQMIRNAEMELGVHLPATYVHFLKNYGQGGFTLFAVLGFRQDGTPVFVDATEDYRKFYQLPHSYVVVEENDDGNYCINTANGRVCLWRAGWEKGVSRYRDFKTYFRTRILDTVTDPDFELARRAANPIRNYS